jgi:mono/diheme cytochrome c family protein
MKEEIKRIEQVQQMQKQRDMAGSTNLTGEQIFMRSCNTCHPGGQAGMGPTLEKMGEHFPEDQALKAFIRKGKGIMPGQPKETINDEELDSLVTYLRGLTFDK